mmetsp:Transcript_52011/g.173589  ORF Transcript_52011/g.173589 Transcript_52011/m.173589 type:complete len:454 (+) Transcript_52011:242-1603(+)
MSFTLAQLERLLEEARSGTIVASPRASLLWHLETLRETLTASTASGQLRGEASAIAAGPELQQTFVTQQLLSAYDKCARVGACLACTINPCICEQLPPLPIGHHDRIVLLLHPKEFLRTTNSGKLLLLAHPHASFLVPGVPEHDARLATICERRGACVLYPAEDALPIGSFLARLEGEAAVAQQQQLEGETAMVTRVGGSGGGGGNPATTTTGAAQSWRRPPLDLIILDGTWQQARHMGRKLPPSLPRVRVCDIGGASSLFGTTLRKQSAARAEAGRVSTVEAYAAAALELGEEADAVRKLLACLPKLIRALAPFSNRAGADAGGIATQEKGVASQGGKRTQYRRRAFWLTRQLAAGAWTDAAREALVDVLADPRVNGCTVSWSADAPAGHAVLLGGAEKRELGSFALAKVLAPAAAVGGDSRPGSGRVSSGTQRRMRASVGGGHAGNLGRTL